MEPHLFSKVRSLTTFLAAAIVATIASSAPLPVVAGARMGPAVIVRYGPHGRDMRMRRYGYRPSFFRTTATTTDGAAPYGPIVADPAGNLYGTTTAGGTNDNGTVFKLLKTSAGFTYSILYRFTGPDGSAPNGPLLIDKTGNIYGTTSAGGYSSSLGTVFKLTLTKGAYVESVLYKFRGLPDGAFPNTGVLMNKDGYLFGSTDGGGSNYDCESGPNDTPGCGMVFRLSLTSTGAYRELIIDSFATDDGSPDQLTADASGDFYSTAESGADENGEAFELTPGATAADAYTQKDLWEAVYGSGPVQPEGGVIADSKGYFYGTSYHGGAYCSSTGGCGTAYRLAKTTKGTYVAGVMHSFASGKDGSQPTAGLIADSSGAFYGTTTDGGVEKCYLAGTTILQGCGTVFKLTPNSAGTAYSETVLYSFKGGTDSGVPLASLYGDSAGNLYGTNSGSGISTDFGDVFKLTRTKTGYTESVVYKFKG
jgi:uncharacterized repeat protein (TIGR03803 family)